MHLTIALDWTPNLTHAGIFVAQAKGYYAAENLIPTLRSPSDDGYRITPAKRVARRGVELAMAPSESVLSYNAFSDPVPLRAVATLMQVDTSVLATLPDRGLSRPKQLDGHTYASYGARFEDGIVRAVIQHDGGEGNFEITRPPKLGIWQALREDQCQATWVLTPWRHVAATEQESGLNTFPLRDFGVPYGYAPVLLTHALTLEQNREALQTFLQATARGYRDLTQDDPTEIARMLDEAVPSGEFKDRALTEANVRKHRTHFLNESGQWGVMEAGRWEAFVGWLFEQKLVRTMRGDEIAPDTVDVSSLYTNELLDNAGIAR
ncbi:MAG: ABC transporter substrate-binding protein [Catalinimonas sp.]